MKYRIELIEKDIFNDLVTELGNTPLAGVEQLSNLSVHCSGLINYNQFRDTTLYSEVTFYSVNNEKLNKLLKLIFKTNLDKPFSIHCIDYFPNGAVNEHKDQSSIETYVILLDDNYTGAELFLNSKPVPFNKKGQYVYYKGIDTLHYTTPVKSGIRKVLAVFYGKENNNNNNKSVL